MFSYVCTEMAGRNVLQRKTFYFNTWYAFQNLYFITFTWVKKLSQYFYLYQGPSLFTQSVQVNNACTFATSENQQLPGLSEW